MNREIKFRAWVHEAMVSVVNLKRYDDGSFLINKDAQISNTALMQFTGLKDKNGKEIYEGDVVMYSEMILSESEKAKEIQGAGAVFIPPQHAVIEWDDEGADFQIVMNQTIRGMNARGDYSIEVIGNVWEHPDLLTS